MSLPTSFARDTPAVLGTPCEWSDVAHRFTLDPNTVCMLLHCTRLPAAAAGDRKVPVNHLAAEARGWYPASSEVGAHDVNNS